MKEWPLTLQEQEVSLWGNKPLKLGILLLLLIITANNNILKLKIKMSEIIYICLFIFKREKLLQEPLLYVCKLFIIN